jgi:hypothetical protein
VFSFLGEALAFIGDLVVKAVSAMAGVVLFAIFTAINGLFALAQLILDALADVTPSLPEVSAPPEWVAAINWFFPLVTLVGVATTLAVSYVAFLAVKWVYKKYGAL